MYDKIEKNMGKMELGQSSYTLHEKAIILFEYRLLEAKIEYYTSFLENKEQSLKKSLKKYKKVKYEEKMDHF